MATAAPEGRMNLSPKGMGMLKVLSDTHIHWPNISGRDVPFMDFKAQRGPDELVPFYEEMGPDGVTAYWKKKNSCSTDGYETGILDDY